MTKQICSIYSRKGKLIINSLLFISAFGALSGCGEKDHNGKAKAGQSIVSVNGEEITVHQVNDQLKNKKIDPKQKVMAGKKVVQSLIDREVLVQAAKSAKLDRNPNVMTAIETSKMQILAQAYMQQKISNLAKPTAAEISAFRGDNPNIFANRKLYAMDEVSFVIEKELASELEKLSDEATSMEEVLAWLNENSIQFTQSKAVHPAEKLPKVLLDKMSKMAKGELVFINGPAKIVVGKLLDTRLQPISVGESKPLIERALMNKKQQAAAAVELERLKAEANIIYIDDTYKMTSKKSTVQKTTESSAQVGGEPKKDDVADHVEKGLSGM